jgi:hypothetical protein
MWRKSIRRRRRIRRRIGHGCSFRHMWRRRRMKVHKDVEGKQEEEEEEEEKEDHTWIQVQKLVEGNIEDW